jgi:hypothetical protein
MHLFKNISISEETQELATSPLGLDTAHKDLLKTIHFKSILHIYFCKCFIAVVQCMRQ